MFLRQTEMENLPAVTTKKFVFACLSVFSLCCSQMQMVKVKTMLWTSTISLESRQHAHLRRAEMNANLISQAFALAFSIDDSHLRVFSNANETNNSEKVLLNQQALIFCEQKILKKKKKKKKKIKNGAISAAHHVWSSEDMERDFKAQTNWTW